MGQTQMDEHLKALIKAMWQVLRSPGFLLLTLIGNGFIAVCAGFFFMIERGINPNVNHYIDGLWWAFATATTTGYGDITPKTHEGKILSVVLMLSGLALFAMYTALFAEAILTIKPRKD
jgi:voltage-gated potassium channel